MANYLNTLGLQNTDLTNKESQTMLKTSSNERENRSSGSNDPKHGRTEIQLNPARLLTTIGPKFLDVSKDKVIKQNLPHSRGGSDRQQSNYLDIQCEPFPETSDFENGEILFGYHSQRPVSNESYDTQSATNSMLDFSQNTHNCCEECQNNRPKSLETDMIRSGSNLPCDCSLVSTSGHKSLPIFPTQDRLNGITPLNDNKYLKKHKSIPYLHSALLKQNDNVKLNDVEQSEKVKSKIMSVWNNVRYGWTLKTKTNFGKDSPIFLLGCCYHKRPDDDEPEPGQVSHSPPSMELFKQDFQSRLWFTYRRGFPTLPQTKFTTDCGWGCMLRSSQMMLSQALICHFLGRDWRVHNQTKEQETFYRQIIKWFGDSPSDQCPFSLHHLVEFGKVHGKQAGEWYGPSSVSYIIRDAVVKASLSQPVLKDLCIYVAQDCTVYKQDIIEMCCTRPRNLTSSVESNIVSHASSSRTNDTEWKRSVIILIPVRLGGEDYNPIYSPCLKNLMAVDSCIGIIGGKPKHSLYFIGWQEDKLIYLDPHFCQDHVDVLKRDFKIESFHCFSPRKVTLGKMDPSACVGFYCRTRKDFENFVEHTEEMVTPRRGSGLYPMFVFNEGKGSDMKLQDLSLSEEKYVRVKHATIDQSGKIRSSTIDSEEFVVL